MKELKVRVENTWSRAAGEPPELRRLLDQMHAVEVPGAGEIKRYHAKHVKAKRKEKSCILCRSPGWDLKKHFVTQAGAIPTGLLVDAATMFAEEGHVLKLLDRREKPEGHPREYGVTLRDDQRALANRVMAAHAGTIEAATAFGKTVLNVALSAELGVPTLIVVPAKELVKQYVERFEEHGGITPNRWSGAPPWEIGEVNVSTLALLSKHVKGVAKATEDIDFLIIDEAHHCKSRSWYKTIMRIDAYYRLAQTGTLPLDDDFEWMHIQSCAGPLLGSVTAAELTEREGLAETRVFMLPSGLGGEGGRLKHFTDEYRRDIVNCEPRNAYVEEVMRGCVDLEMRALVLCKWGEHVHGLDDRCIDIEERVDWIVADEMSHGEVSKRRHKLDIGETEVLVATTLFDEGLDVPNLDLLIMAGGGEAEGRTKQRMGRVRRLGRTGRAAVIDFTDDHHRHLRRHSETRRQWYEDEGCTVEDVMLPAERVPELMEEISHWLRTGERYLRP